MKNLLEARNQNPRIVETTRRQVVPLFNTMSGFWKSTKLREQFALPKA